MMALLPAVLGLIAATSGLIAGVARFRVEPLYSIFVSLSRKTRRLQVARDVLDEERTIKIADKQEILELIHRVAAEEYEHISERRTPVEFEWVYNGFRFRYAEQQRESQINSPGIEEEMVGHFDRRISEHLGRISVGGTTVAIVGFALAILTALL